MLHPPAIHVAVSGTFNSIWSVALAALTLDSGVNINTTWSVGKISRNRIDETLITQAHTYICNDKFSTVIFGYDGI